VLDRLLKGALLVLLLAAVGVSVALFFEARRLRERLQTVLLEPKVVTLTERVPFGVPQPYPLTLPGSKETVPVVVERERTVFRDLPAQKVTVQAPSVYCQTREECDRLYQASEQRLTLKVTLKEGTPIPVRLDGQERILPVARDVPFVLQAVLGERGAFVGMNLPDTGLRIETITTETVLPAQVEPIASPRVWPNLTIHPFSGEVSGAGASFGPMVHYQNALGDGVYQVWLRWEAVGVGRQPGQVWFGVSWGLPVFR
jgi:hypothetical protein